MKTNGNKAHYSNLVAGTTGTPLELLKLNLQLLGLSVLVIHKKATERISVLFIRSYRNFIGMVKLNMAHVIR